MRLCSDTVTVLNARVDASTGFMAFYPTVITGVSWYGDTASVIDASGLKAADRITIRIPTDADFSGKTFVNPSDYDTADTASSFTLRAGDVIVRGAVDTSAELTPATVRAQFGDAATILSVTDNRRAPRAPHFKVVGH